VLFSLVYLLLRRLVHLVAGPSHQRNSELELLVLRHQLKGPQATGGQAASSPPRPAVHPDSAWITQQARNLAVGDRLRGVRFLIRDRDSKFIVAFDEVFRSEGVRIIQTPVRAPRANAFAERWVRTVRTECLDWMLVFGRRHLERVLRTYISHYNARRPHRGLELKTPEPRLDPAPCLAQGARIRRRDVLGGLVHEYELAA
jgi:putative transposase